jgi:translation initiation factor 1A
LKKLKEAYSLSKKKEEELRNEQEQQEIRRAVLPRGNQVFGLLEQRLGGSRNRVRCMDGKTRICRIPGRLKRKLWVREGDLLLIEPWEHGGEDKADIIFKYRNNQIDYLKQKGFLKGLNDLESF